MFVPGAIYPRRAIHDLFGGQPQGGISTPSKARAVLLFVDDSGRSHGYSDGWTSQGLFLYTGEGQRGNMVFKRGNAAIRDHAANGKAIHLFRQAHHLHVEYVGEMVHAGSTTRLAPDTDGNMREVIVFELRRAAEAT